MKQIDIPFYSDPDDFRDGDNKYPCSTQFMHYDGLQHKYFLTEECLNYHGIDVERRYISGSNNKMREFISLVTQCIYDYIQYKSGWRTFQVMLYRIATVPEQIYQDKYIFRKQFEEVLILQAKYLIENGCSANYSGVNISRGKESGINPELEFRDNSHVSPLAVTKLDFMGLTRWFMLPSCIRLDTEKY